MNCNLSLLGGRWAPDNSFNIMSLIMLICFPCFLLLAHGFNYFSNVFGSCVLFLLFVSNVSAQSEAENLKHRPIIQP